jgi:hypothetical protein
MVESESSSSESSYEEDRDRTSISTNMEAKCDSNPKLVRSSSSNSDFCRSNKTAGFCFPKTRLKSQRRRHCGLQDLMG